MKLRLPIDEATLTAFCRKHAIRRLSLFGSVLKGTARPDSDVDLLVVRISAIADADFSAIVDGVSS